MNQIIEFTSAYRQLRPSEKVFVDGYVSDLETVAVRTGVKLRTLLAVPVGNDIDDRAAQYLALSLVRAAITERVNEISEDMELTVYKTLKEARNIAYSNIGNYMDIGEDGHPYFDLARCTPEQLAAIKSIEINEDVKGRKFKFVLHDKIAALDKIMKYQGLLDAEHWKAEKIADNRTKTLTMDTSDEHAADLYAGMING